MQRRITMQFPLAAPSEDQKNDCTLLIRMVNDANCYSEVMNTVVRFQGVVEMQRYHQKEPFHGTVVVTVVFEELERKRMAHLQEELQRCCGIIEITETKK